MKDQPLAGTRNTLLGWWCVWLLLLATLLLVWRQKPEVMTDAGTCLLAAEQYQQRKELPFHTLLEVNPKNLDQEIPTRITWWPASYSAIPYVLRQTGLNWGQSLQLVFLAGWAVGIWGWTCFFRRLLSPKLLPWIVAAFLTFRYTHANANVYDAGEFLFWALLPWVLLANIQCMKTDRLNHWRPVSAVLLAALLTTLLVTVKYSAGLSALGIAIAWIFVVLRHQVPLQRFGWWLVGAILGTLFVTQTGLLSSGNPGTVRNGMQWTVLCWAPGAWTFAITDLESLVARLFLLDNQQSWLPAIGRYGDGQVAFLSPFTLGLVLSLWYLLRRETATNHSNHVSAESNSAWNPSLSFQHRQLIKTVVVVHLVSFTIVLSGLILAGSAIHMDSRFLRPAAIAFLPFLLAGIMQAFQSTQQRTRMVGTISLGLFIVIPALYGTATATYKTIIRGSTGSAKTGPLGIRHDLLDSTGNAQEFYKELATLRSGATTTYYLLEHALALPLAKQRILVEHAHLRSREHLAGKRYRGHPKDGIILVLPENFAQNGKLAAIQDSFVDIRKNRWKTTRMKSQPSWLVSISTD